MRGPQDGLPGGALPGDYRIRRSPRARRARLTVGDDGLPLVVLPRRAPLREAALLVEAHSGWLERQVARVGRERAVLASRPALGAGRILEIGGAPYRTATVEALHDVPARGRVEAAGGTLIIRLGRDGRPAPLLLEGWLRGEARRVIGGRVEALAPLLGVRPRRLTIRDQRTRWASASVDGSLSFSWRLVLAPPEVLEAIVVHELAHLVVRGHPSAFWRLVHAHAPHHRVARRWLREHARELRAALE